MGAINISWQQLFQSKDETLQLIVHQRILSSFTAAVAGCFLSLSGLLLQVLFRNILAGPSVLGITSGSSFGVAFFMFLMNSLLGVSYFSDSFSLVLFALAGSFITLLLLVWVSKKINSSSTLLIIGLMLSFVYSAGIDLLRFYFDKNQLQFFSVWNMASFQSCTWHQFYILLSLCLLGLFISLFTLKQMDIYMLGDDVARSMGVPIQRFTSLILVSSGIMVSVITAYCGPVAFIGLAVPLLARLLGFSPFYRSNFFLVMLLGAILSILCNVISKSIIPSQIVPLNSIASLIGIPIILLTLVKNKTLD